MAACPVAAIRVETLAQRRHDALNKTAVEDAWTTADQHMVDRMSLSNNKPFPRPFLSDESLSVYWLGHHNEASFGATPYLLETTVGVNSAPIHVMIDTPKYSISSVKAVERITGPKGPDYLFLTHVDDTADHGKWVDHYQGTLKRVFHAGDLGRHNWLGDQSLAKVEQLLPLVPANGASLTAYSLDGTILTDNWLTSNKDSVVILHTPGHSPGSITLWDRHQGILFTGDTYAWTTREGGHMSGFPRYGYDLRQQADTLRKLVELPGWTMVAPGHGHPRDYRLLEESAKGEELQEALQELIR
jgi:glyoxylase-like metal-dependent hydrolase (beta-lactamase superfamily II)